MGLCINLHCEKAKKQEDQGLSLFCTGCGSNLLINDLYRVIKHLGSGGFGTTYLVDDCGTYKVLKILHNDDPKAIALFDQEALVLQNLDNPGIPKVEPGGRFDYFPRGNQKPLRCLVMEYIEGETLKDYLAKNNYRPISEQAAMRWLQQLMEILLLIHSANYFHRDIKPANVMLRSSGQIALIDFGTAREETETYFKKLQGSGSTIAIVSKGYTPNEQANGKAEYRSDFFALGRTFVFLLTGKTPDQFQDSLKKGLIWQQEAQGYRQELRDLIDELMRPDINERPINAQVVLDKLKPLAAFYRTQAKINVLPSQITTPTPTNQKSGISITRRNVILGSLGIVGLSGLAIISQKKLGIFSANVKNFTEILPGDVPLEMIGISAGEFTMGASDFDPDAKPNEKPAHLVKIKSFAIGKYPITRRQWRAVFDPLNLDEYFDREYFNDFPDLPIEWVSWNKTQEFCQKLKKLTKKNYDLPSEAQWEYACRAGTTSRFYWGDDVKKINNHAWFVDNSGGASHVVGEKVPNAWGLYDMAGNVWEWCADNWRNNYSSLSVDDNGENEHNQLGILRGGCWGCSAVDSRSSNRQKIDKNYASKTIGLRIIYSF